MIWTNYEGAGHWHPPCDQFFSVSNDTAGIKEAIHKIKPLMPTRVLIEATGRLEMEFVCRAHQARLPVVVCNAAQVRQFAKVTGRLAKTDRLDAQDIAHFGEALQPNFSVGFHDPTPLITQPRFPLRAPAVVTQASPGTSA